MQLIVLVYQVSGYLNLVVQDHVVVRHVESVVHVTHDKVIITHNVRVKFLSFDLELFKELFHHLVSLHSVVLAVNEMNSNKVIVHPIQTEVNLHSSFVTDHIAHSTGFNSSALTLHKVHLRSLDVSNNGHFPLACFCEVGEVKFFHVLAQTLDKCCSFVPYAFLEANDNQVVVLWTNKQMLKVDVLRLPCQVPGNG